MQDINSGRWDTNDTTEGKNTDVDMQGDTGNLHFKNGSILTILRQVITYTQCPLAGLMAAGRKRA